MEQDYNLKKWSKGCPNTGVNCRRSSCGIEYVFIPAALGDDQEGSPVAPKNGSYNNAIVYYEATGNVYLYSSDGVPTRVEKNLDSIIAELQRELNNVEEALSEETSAREAADAAIEQEIEDLRNEPDVVDIVGTYADLLAYDTSNLGDKDIIRVLVDETHDDESTYYRWNKTPQTWTYIGAIDGYYTKDQTDTLLEGKQDVLTAGTNVQISSQNVISATDTTYDVFTGATAQSGGTYGLVPGPRQGDQGKVLGGNGEWVEQQDTTYTAGTGLNLNGTEFSVDLTTIAEKSDIPTTAAEVHALPDSTKYGATLTLTIDSSTYVATAQLKDQDGNTLGTAQTIDLPLESVVVSGSYDSQTKEVVLTLQSGSTIRFSVADLVSGLQETLIAGTNIQIASDGKTISATDTTYSDFTGTDGQTAGAAGLVPAPAIADAEKFLKADGTWDAINASSITPLTTADFNANYNNWNDTDPANFNCIALWKLEDGIYEPQTESSTQDYRIYSATDRYSSTTSISSTRQELFIVLRMIPSLYPNTIINIDHNGNISYRTITVASSGATATTYRVSSATPRSEIYYTDSTGVPTTSRIEISGTTTGSLAVSIGNSSRASGYSAALGYYARATGSSSTAVGSDATASGDGSTAVGRNTTASADNSVALGSYATPSRGGEVNVGTGTQTYGYNNTSYRLIGGVHDPQSAHDAATKGYVDGLVGNIAAALNAINNGGGN